MRLRFAPSPTGYFHVGSGRSALFNWALAEQQDGTFILRIEDTDAERNRDEWTQGIIDALAWLGISAHDPRFEGPYFQSQFAEQHRQSGLLLYEQGDAYYCDCTRDQIDAAQRGHRSAGLRRPLLPDVASTRPRGGRCASACRGRDGRWWST